MLADVATLHAEVADFIERHCACGALTGDAGDATARGYMLTIACPCGVTSLRVGHDVAGRP